MENNHLIYWKCHGCLDMYVLFNGMQKVIVQCHAIEQSRAHYTLNIFTGQHNFCNHILIQQGHAVTLYSSQWQLAIAQTITGFSTKMQYDRKHLQNFSDGETIFLSFCK